MHGEGTFFCVDGRAFHGQWKNGMQVQDGNLTDVVIFREGLWKRVFVEEEDLFQWKKGKSRGVYLADSTQQNKLDF